MWEWLRAVLDRATTTASQLELRQRYLESLARARRIMPGDKVIEEQYREYERSVRESRR